MSEPRKPDFIGQAGRGREAERPSQIPWNGWRDILKRVALRISRDRVSVIAAGTAFFVLLALFPAMAAFVSLYGLFADPASIAEHIEYLAAFVPETVVEIVQDQLARLIDQGSGSLSLAFMFGLVIAIWSANNGTKTLRVAMNVAYGETEKRGFVKLTLVTLAVTVAGMAVIGFLLIVLAVLPGILSTLGIGHAADQIIRWARWPLLFALAALSLSLLYRYGPSRSRAKWRWVTWGSVLATTVWFGMSLLFSWYLSNFASYNATYGSIGAVVGLLVWSWLSLFAIIVGAELDAEIEHQTGRDSTVGPPRPMGQRGAVVADTIGATAEAVARRERTK